MVIVNVCGNGAAGAGLYRVCQMVAVLPSRTLPAAPFSFVVS
jgi:hypothetical protein